MLEPNSASSSSASSSKINHLKGNPPGELTDLSSTELSTREIFRSIDQAPRVGTSLLACTPNQQAYLDLLKTTLAPYGVHEVQKWDETKTPPLEILRAMTADGVFVSGVPLPDYSSAAALLANEKLRALLSPEKIQKLEALKEPNPCREAMGEFLKTLGEEGFNKAMALASMEIPKQTSVGVATFLGVNTGLSAQTIAKIGSEEQQAFWLNALNNGVFTYGFGLTEEKIGSDPRSLETTFKKETDAEGNTVYRLNGNKKFIGNAACVKDASGNVVHPGADFLLVYAVDDPNKAPKDRTFHVFMVPRTLIGEENIWHSGREHNKMGLREVNNGDFQLKDVVIPEVCRLGKVDEDIYPKMAGLLDITRLFVGAMSLGTSEACLEAAQGYAARRVQNGGLINQFQMVAFPLEDLEGKVLASKLLVMEAARLVDQSEKEKADLVKNIAGAKKEFETATATISRLADGVLSVGVAEELRAVLSQGNSAFAELSENLKVKHGKKPVLESIKGLQGITRQLRDKFGAGEKQTEIKSAYKALIRVSEALNAAREPVRFGTETAMAKLFCSELAEEAARTAINTLGGNGFIERPEQGLGLPKRHRDAKVLTIYEGTSNIQRNLISQGMILRELKDIENNLRDALRFMLLKSSATKSVHYNILMGTSATPVERVNAAYKYTVVDVMTRYDAAHKAIKRQWEKSGVPAEYQGWDEKSLDRQQNLLASLPVQARMGILADVATYRKLVHLASRHIEGLSSQPSLSEEQKREIKVLRHFETHALDKVIELSRKLDSESLKQQEAAYLKAQGLL